MFVLRPLCCRFWSTLNSLVSVITAFADHEIVHGAVVCGFHGLCDLCVFRFRLTCQFHFFLGRTVLSSGIVRERFFFLFGVSVFVCFVLLFCFVVFRSLSYFCVSCGLCLIILLFGLYFLSCPSVCGWAFVVVMAWRWCGGGGVVGGMIERGGGDEGGGEGDFFCSGVFFPLFCSCSSLPVLFLFILILSFSLFSSFRFFFSFFAFFLCFSFLLSFVFFWFSWPIAAGSFSKYAASLNKTQRNAICFRPLSCDFPPFKKCYLSGIDFSTFSIHRCSWFLLHIALSRCRAWGAQRHSRRSAASCPPAPASG